MKHVCSAHHCASWGGERVPDREDILDREGERLGYFSVSVDPPAGLQAAEGYPTEKGPVQGMLFTRSDQLLELLSAFPTGKDYWPIAMIGLSPFGKEERAPSWLSLDPYTRWRRESEVCSIAGQRWPECDLPEYRPFHTFSPMGQPIPGPGPGISQPQAFIIRWTTSHVCIELCLSQKVLSRQHFWEVCRTIQISWGIFLWVERYHRLCRLGIKISTFKWIRYKQFSWHSDFDDQRTQTDSICRAQARML